MGRQARVGPGALTRRQLLGVAAVSAASLALAACGSAAPASSASTAPATAGGGGSSQAPAGSWDELLANAKKEGKVVVNGPPDAETRDKLPAAFRQKFGIDMEFLGGNSSQLAARIQSERAAGQYSMDGSISGSDTMYETFLKNGWLVPLKPSLLLPDAADASKWKAGAPWFRDPKQDTVLQIFNAVTPSVTINTQFISPKDVATADALLDPKLKGKICSYDPGVNGAGIATASSLYIGKGEDYAVKLYKGQNVALSRDYKQVADWVAHGTYPIGLAAPVAYFPEYIKAGIPIEWPEMSDAPNAVGGAFSDVAIWDHAPHPNAARVFANWIASKEGMQLYGQIQVQVPVRNDIDPTWAPAVTIPKPGVKYLDTYSYEFETTQRIVIRDFYAKILK